MEYNKWNRYILSVKYPLSEISNLSIGENILQWSIIGECGESTDQVVINVVDGEPIIDLIDIVYCLNQ